MNKDKINNVEFKIRFNRALFNSLMGLLSGLLFQIISLWLIAESHDQGLSYSYIKQLHAHTPVIWLLFLFPISGIVTAYILAGSYKRFKAKTTSEVERIKEESKKVFSFTEQLSQGELDAQFETGNEDDELVQSLKNLRDTLKRNKAEEEQRRKEDAQRNWAAEGLAKFSELLRQNNDNIDELAYTIVQNVVEYLEANQSALFIINDDNPDDVYLEQLSAFAYERKKFVSDVKIKLGDGLVGTCALEKQTIYLTDVPDNYVHITSGLGQANPRNVIIVPLKLEENVLGIIEIASFKILEQFEVDFIEKLGESIASTLSNVKINARTNELLKQSQEQADTLKSQEEQMRQNMEEMATTQEDMKRKEIEMQGLLNAIDNTVLKAEFKPDGSVITTNEMFQKHLGYNEDELENKNISLFIPDIDRKEHNQVWDKIIKDGKPYQGIMKRVTKTDEHIWVLMSYNPIFDTEGNVERVLFLANDITKQKQVELEAKAQSEELAVQEHQLRANMEEMKAVNEEMERNELEMSGMLTAIDNTIPKAEFRTDGSLLTANDRFFKLFEYQPDEVIGENVKRLIPDKEVDSFANNWKKLLAGHTYKGIVKQITKTGEEIWVIMSYTPVRDKDSKVAKILYLANDITRQKRVEIKAKEQAKILRKQEEKLLDAQDELERKLEETRQEVQSQFAEIEKVKVRNEKTLEGALDAIFTINQKGIVQFFNKAAEEMWDTKREDVLGQHVQKLFSEDKDQLDDFILRLIDPEKEKIVGERKEISITKSTGEEASVLILLSDAEVGDEHTYTAFIQNIEVELF